jgi:hypothetical protein
LVCGHTLFEEGRIVNRVSAPSLFFSFSLVLSLSGSLSLFSLFYMLL